MILLWKIFLKSVDLMDTLRLKELKRRLKTVFLKSNLFKNKLFIF